MSDFLPDWVSPPGDTIQAVLDDRKIGLEDLGSALGMGHTECVDLLRGNISITPNMAEGLEKLFNVSRTFWLSRQKNYESELKRLGYLCAVDYEFQYRRSQRDGSEE